MHRILFVIRSLDVGGAQRQLLQLVRGMNQDHFAITVVTLYDGGELWEELASLPRVRVISLGKRGRWDWRAPLVRLWRVVKTLRPHVVHGYMPLANELALAAGRIAGAKVVWGIRASNIEPGHYDWLTSRLLRLEPTLSRYADLIVVNSVAGRDHHGRLGFATNRMVVIRNGVDTRRFAPDSDAGRTVRAQLGIADREWVIGLVGRLDPMKDHDTFIRAAGRFAVERPEVRFVCAGDGPSAHAARLRQLSTQLGLGDRMLWLGTVQDMRGLYNALDVATSCSAFGEGFSNVVAEAMACGVPCVVTDVGDARVAVGDSGVVIRPRNSGDLLQAWRSLLMLPERDRMMRGATARTRILEQFDSERMVHATERVLIGLLQG